MPCLEIEKKRLFYTQVEAESPRAGSPVLVFIHGLGSSHSFYTPVMGHLAAAGYPSVAFDVYGSCSSV
jgi:alpha-beta hydrolase superfamily lysophospholipase